MKVEVLVAIIGALEGIFTSVLTIVLTSPKGKGARRVAGVTRIIVVVVAALAAVAVVVMGFWLWPILTKEPPASADAWVDSFEAKKIATDWELGYPQDKKECMQRSDDSAFSGRHSLKLDCGLTQRTDFQDAEGTIQLLLKREVKYKVVAARFFLPEDAPENLFAGLFLLDSNGAWISGPSRNLPVGEWFTLTWNTADAQEWQPPGILGIQVNYQLAKQGGAVDKYDGPIYVDMVELLTLPEVYQEWLGLDRMLVPNPSHLYNFEGAGDLPSTIEEDGHVTAMALSDEEALPDGEGSLKLEVNLPIWNQEEDRGSVYFDLENIERVDAISTYVLVPKAGADAAEGFELGFKAVDEQGLPVWSGSQPILVGDWTPQFWGTRYAHNGDILCPDSDGDGACDTPADKLWYQWTETHIKGFYINIIRKGEGYEGPVYLDNVTIYRLSP